jgi:hypothetical protein
MPEIAHCCSLARTDGCARLHHSQAERAVEYASTRFKSVLPVARHAPIIIVIAPAVAVTPVHNPVSPTMGAILATRYKPAFAIVAE